HSPSVAIFGAGAVGVLAHAVAARDGQAGDPICGPGFGLEYAAAVVAADRQLPGTQTVDHQIIGDEKFATRERDGVAGQAAVKDDLVGPSVRVGRDNGVAQRSGTAVGVGRDVVHAWNRPTFE